MAIGAAILNGYCSILRLSLSEYSRGEIENQLSGVAVRRRLAWLVDNEDEVMLSTAIWRRLFAVLMLFSAILSVHPASGNPTTMLPAVVSAGIVLTWLWVVEIGLAWAIAEHASSAVVRSSLWIFPILFTLMIPLTAPLNWLSEVVRRLLGVEHRDDLEEDLRQVVEEGERDGNIGEIEREMIEAIVDFRTATVDEVMTPRIDVNGIKITYDLDRIKEFVLEEGHSRYPVYEEDLDHIKGILYVKDLVPYLGSSSDTFVLQEHLRDPAFVPESKKISDILTDFQRTKVHMAVVLDEYGGTAGLITIEDVVEEIVGEIRDEHDPDDEPDPQIRVIDNGTIEVDARFHIDDLNDEVGCELPEEDDYDTVGGWVFSGLGRIPNAGETFVLNCIEVTVLSAEKTRLHKLQLRLLKGDEVEETTENGNS